MQPPTIYFLNRKMTEEQKQKVRDLLSVTPLQAVIITDPRDTTIAREFCEEVSYLQRPIAILADFDAPLTEITQDGTLWQTQL